MRIIAGEFRRRLLKAPEGQDKTRPLPDRVKESLFGLLRGHCQGARVLDCFAGSGAFGLEMISRGAAHVVMVERDRLVARILQANIDTLGVRDRAELLQGDALGPATLARCPQPATVIFFDPPYPLVEDPGQWARLKAQFEALIPNLADDGFAVLRTPLPFTHEIRPEPAAEAPKLVRPWQRGKPKKSRREDRDDAPRKGSPAGGPARGGESAPRQIKVESWDDLPEDLEAVLSSGASVEFEVPAEAPKPERVPVDLTMKGAVGPETHEYRSMAVHFYQKAR
jgi:16S rRNA (guanine966-N2)-methyltransferase